jgi:F0F1-type ATP synthase assembly protein I
MTKGKVKGLFIFVVLGASLSFYSASHSKMLDARLWDANRRIVEARSRVGESAPEQQAYLNSHERITIEEVEEQIALAQFVVAAVIIGLVFGLLTGKVASSKGHDSNNWFYIGFFFSIVGLIAAAGLGTKKADVG